MDNLLDFTKKLTLIRKPNQIIAIYDNSSTDWPYVDCMTFVLYFDDGRWDRSSGPKDCLTTCPTGRRYSKFSTCDDGPHLGKPVQWYNLSLELQKHVRDRIARVSL